MNMLLMIYIHVLLLFSAFANAGSIRYTNEDVHSSMLSASQILHSKIRSGRDEKNFYIYNFEIKRVINVNSWQEKAIDNKKASFVSRQKLKLGGEYLLFVNSIEPPEKEELIRAGINEIVQYKDFKRLNTSLEFFEPINYPNTLLIDSPVLLKLPLHYKSKKNEYCEFENNDCIILAERKTIKLTELINYLVNLK